MAAEDPNQVPSQKTKIYGFIAILVIAIILAVIVNLPSKSSSKTQKKEPASESQP